MKKVIVIGAGASGLIAAYFAAKQGNQVIVIEKNEKCGKKIYITGKGRCNITNDICAEDFLTNVVTNAKFLTGCIYSFPPQALMSFLEEGGLKLKRERGGRVFPLSDKASDVSKCLEKYCQKVNVTFHFNETVKEICALHSTMSNVVTDKNIYSCDACIVCTGGLSYPGTGSCGDGYTFAKSLGHKIVPLVPALTGINLQDKDISSLQGLTLKNVIVSAYYKNKSVRSLFGEMLFTHFGISGPCVLSLSSLLNRINLTEVEIFIDLKPALNNEMLDKRILRDFNLYKNKNISNALFDLLPNSLVPVIIARSKIAQDTPVHSVTRKQREALISVIKNFSLHPVSLRNISEAIVTSGGIDVKEVNPKTMESRLVTGLYFCGEILDVDAYTGGYNLQIAFSTGYAAGNHV